MATQAIRVLLQAITGPYEASMGRAAAVTRGFAGAASSATVPVGQLRDAQGRYIAGASRATNATDLWGKGLDTLAKKAGAIGVAGGLLMSGKAIVEYEKALVGVGKTTGLTGDELDALGEDLDDLAQRIDGSFQDMAGIGQVAAQLGIAKEDIVEFTELAAGMASATGLSAEQVATDMARLANITQTPADEFQNLGSAVVDLGNNMATTEGEILAMSQRIAAAGTAAGMSASDVVALAAAASEVGVEAEAGGTAISTMVAEINASVIDGSENLSVFAETAGMSAEQFTEAWREDPTNALLGFLSGMDEFQQSGGNTVALMDDMGLDGRRLADVLGRLSGNHEGVTRAVERSNAAYEDGTAVIEEAAAVNETAAVALDNLGDAWSKFLRSLLGNNPEAIRETADALRWLLNVTSELDLQNIIGASGQVGGNAARWVREQLGWAEEATVSFADNQDAMMASSARWAGQAAAYAGAIAEVGEEQYDAAAAAEEHLAASQELADGLRAQVDPIFGIINAMTSAREAQDAANEAIAEHGENSREAEQAVLDLVQAENELVARTIELEGSTEAAAARFLEMRDNGRITQQQLDILLGILGETEAQIDRVAQDHHVDIGTTVDFGAIDDLEDRLSAMLGRDYSIPVRTRSTGGTGRSGGGSSSPSAPTPGTVTFRAGGGDAWMGAAYVVGEAGPEMFVPDTNGRILSTTDAMRALRPAPPVGGMSQVNSGNTNTFAPTVHVEQRTGNAYQDANVELRKIALAVGF